MTPSRTAMRAGTGTPSDPLTRLKIKRDHSSKKSDSALPAAGKNDVGADRKPEGVIADHWNLDEYADDREAGYDEREHECKVHCESSFRCHQICCDQICDGLNEVMAAWLASRDLQNETDAGFSGPAQ